MKFPLPLLIVLLVSATVTAQNFTGSGGAITNNGNPTNFPLNVTGLGNSGNGFGVMEIRLDITHPEMNEITIGLSSPWGTYVELVNSTGIKGPNFSGTALSYTAGTSITAGTAPYSGSFKPIGYFGRFNTGNACNGNWTLVVKDYNPNGNSGSVNSWTICFSNGAPMPVNYSSSNLPLAFINTNGQAISTNTILVDFGIVDNGNARNNLTDPKNGFSGKAKLNIRGSSSQIYQKKSYKIDLCSPDGAIPMDAPLLGMPAESDWVLTSGFADKTLMRNALTSQLFSQVHYSPRTRFVELIINGEYAGVYTLTEKIKRNSQRVAIDKITPMDNNFPHITGGYIIQINRSDDAGWYSLYPGISNSGAKFYYQYVYPHAEDITLQQKNYIKACLDTFETVMNGPDFADPVKGYRKYIDPVSFADLFLINEFSKNIDGYRLSTFLYKDNVLAGGKIHAGPAWDYDIAWKNTGYANANLEQWWQYSNPNDVEPLPTWWQKLLQDSYFQNLVWCRWHTLRKNVYSSGSINAWIDQQAAVLQEGQARNFVQFPILDAYIYPNPASQINSSYQNIVNDLKDWIVKRGTWLDQNIPGFCNDVSVPQLASAENRFTSFPNPFSGQMIIDANQLPEDNYVISLVNAMGQEVLVQDAVPVRPHAQLFEVNTADLSGGTYILKMKGIQNTFYRKVIKTTE